MRRPTGPALAGGLIACALGVACGPPTVARDPEPHTQTTSLGYRIVRHDIGYSARIPFTFTNRTADTVLLDHCEGDLRPLLQVRRDGRWVDAWRPLTRGCTSLPRTIPPAGSLSDTLSVVGSPPGSNVMPSFVFEDVEGVYRLYWFQARRAGAARERAGEAWRVSNPFVLAFP